MMEKDIKQVLCIRSDLKMRKGKMIAQGAHASMKVLLDRKILPRFRKKKKHPKLLVIDLSTEEMAEWVYGTVFKKIVCKINSKKELLDLAKQADKKDIPYSIIEDAGFTEFHGEKTLTCLAIGPDTSEKIDPVTSHLELL